METHTWNRDSNCFISRFVLNLFSDDQFSMWFYSYLCVRYMFVDEIYIAHTFQEYYPEMYRNTGENGKDERIYYVRLRLDKCLFMFFLFSRHLFLIISSIYFWCMMFLLFFWALLASQLLCLIQVIVLLYRRQNR